MPFIQEIPLPERTPDPIQHARRSRKMERSNRAAAFKGIVVNPGEDIQLAIDSMFAVGGGVISLLAGTYYPKSNITLKPNCKLAGENGSTTIIDFANQAYSIIIPNNAGIVSNFHMERITVQNSSTHGLIFQTGTSNVFFFAVDSNNNGGDGFNITGLGGAVLETCNANSNGGYGFYLIDCTLINFTGACAGALNTLDGMYIKSSTYVRAHNFLSQLNLRDGISLSASVGCSTRDTIAIINTRYGIRIAASEFNNILNSQVYSNGSDGVFIDTDSNRNSIVSSVMITNGGWGVRINNANCDKNLLAFDDLGSTANTSGTLSDAGTGTVSVNHIT